MKFFFAALLFVVTGTSGYANDYSSAKQTHMNRVDQFVWEGAVFAKDSSLPALRSLPSLKKETSTKESNRHDQKKEIEFKTFEYEGLQIYGYVMDSGKLGLIKVTVTNPQWKILNELNVGKEFNQVVHFLGVPDTVEGDLKVYNGETERVEFKTKDDLITEIRFFHYTD